MSIFYILVLSWLSVILFISSPHSNHYCSHGYVHSISHVLVIRSYYDTSGSGSHIFFLHDTIITTSLIRFLLIRF